MKTLSLTVLSCAALLVSSLPGALAETSDAPKPAQPKAAQTDQAGPMDNQIANDVDARIAWLKAKLRLTPDQEKNWPGFQTALHDYGVGQVKSLVAGRSAYENRHDRDDQGKTNGRPDDLALMREEASELSLRSVSLSRLADAAEPIYGVLDNHQKRRLIQFMRTEFEIGR
jgi:hypothetical protein